MLLIQSPVGGPLVLGNTSWSVLILILTHQGRVTHICASKRCLRWFQIMACYLVGANPLSKPTTVCCSLDHWEQISGNFNKNAIFFILENIFNIAIYKMAVIRSRSQCVNLSINCRSTEEASNIFISDYFTLIVWCMRQCYSIIHVSYFLRHPVISHKMNCFLDILHLSQHVFMMYITCNRLRGKGDVSYLYYNFSLDNAPWN